MKTRMTWILTAAVAVLSFQGSGVQAQNAAPAGNAANGKVVFIKANCQACHGTMGQGGGGPRLAPNPIPGPLFMNYVRNGKRNPGASVWSGMPPFSTKFISDSELADIYAYVASIPPP